MQNRALVTAKRAVVDAGTKSLSVDMGFAEPKDKPDWNDRPAGDEYVIIEPKTGSVDLNVGDKLELIPGHIDTTVALHDEFNAFFAVSNSRLSGRLQRAARSSSCPR